MLFAFWSVSYFLHFPERVKIKKKRGQGKYQPTTVISIATRAQVHRKEHESLSGDLIMHDIAFITITPHTLRRGT